MAWQAPAAPAPALPAVGFDLWQLDVTNQTSVDDLINKVKDKYGQIDFLFLNAGALPCSGACPWHRDRLTMQCSARCLQHCKCMPNAH